ncbi:hypothetical protein, partial [Mesorhizobium sp. M7A.F.Ca.US.006.04.2.1]|uniref:hypothetical protein n=1 Tax=Mesorhizobium sp. M7A.F.Ca.US.006.04.2.1 TaxID=2496696 RepID=UPI0019D4280B
MHDRPARGRVGSIACDALAPALRPNIECAWILKQLPRPALSVRGGEVVAQTPEGERKVGFAAS